MKYKWIQHNKNNNLIIFFNGWGMDENVVSHLNPENYDVVVFYDYNDLETDFISDDYEKKYVIGWSMGVMIAGVNRPALKTITAKADGFTAICGTPFPIHDEYGIPKKIYNMTIRGFNEASSEKFIKKMFSGKEPNRIITKRSTESKKSELEKLLNYTSENKINYNKIIIGKDDIIIPTKNQINFWSKEQKSFITVPAGHCPFLLYNKWAELI